MGNAQVQKFEKHISDNESFGMSISPDGNEMLFVKAYGGRDSLHIFHAINTLSGWQKLVKAPFTIEGINQIDPSFSPDGKYVLINMIEKESNGYDVFIMERNLNEWGQLRAISPSVNTEAHEFYATMANSGNVYFTRRNESNDIYVSRWRDGEYLEAQPLPFNTNASESNPYIAPNEKYIVFTSKTDNTNGVDLFISFRRRNLWSKPIALGDIVNSELNEFCPSIDIKNKRFLFSRTEVLEESRAENMFFIPLKQLKINKLKKQAVYLK